MNLPFRCGDEARKHYDSPDRSNGLFLQSIIPKDPRDNPNRATLPTPNPPKTSSVGLIAQCPEGFGLNYPEKDMQGLRIIYDFGICRIGITSSPCHMLVLGSKEKKITEFASFSSPGKGEE